MKKTISILMAIALFLTNSNTVSCVLKAQAQKCDELVFTEITLNEWELGLRGRFTETATDNARYLFSGGTKDEMTELIRDTEIILSVAKEEYSLQPKTFQRTIRICFVSDETETRINPINGTYADVVINLNEAGWVGAIFSFISGGKLPAWLCSGLGLYWLEKHGVSLDYINKDIDIELWNNQTIENELPDFGDMWLTPGLITNDLSEDVLTIAYSFVKYLSESNQLSELVTLYMDERTTWEAEYKRASLWGEFSGIDGDLNGYCGEFSFRYLYNNRNSNFSDPMDVGIQYNYITFSVLGKHGAYYFTSTDWWDANLVLDYVKVSEDAIEYTKEWFGYEDDKPFPVIFQIMRPNKQVSGFTTHNEIHIFANKDSFAYLPWLIAHESVHFITFRDIATKQRNATPLEEALAVAVNLLYIMDIKDSEIAKSMFHAQITDLDSFSELLGSEYDLKNYYLRRANANGSDVKRLDAHAFADTLAMLTLRLLNLDLEYPTYEQLSSNDTILEAVAPSFILFLLNEGTKENFLNVFFNENLFEEVYGTGMDGMIRNWYDYLFHNWENDAH